MPADLVIAALGGATITGLCGVLVEIVRARRRGRELGALPAVAPLGGSGKPRLLIVDDSAEDAALAERAATAAGWEVHVAASVTEAQALRRIWPYERIIVDHGLPNEDAEAFVRALRTPVWILSGADRRELARLRTLGIAERVLPKSARMAELREALTEVGGG